MKPPNPQENDDGKISPPTPTSSTTAQNNIDRLVQRKPQSNPTFWSSTPGRKAMTALLHVQPKLVQDDKENVPHDATAAAKASAKEIARRVSHKSTKNNKWRRSFLPLPGQMRGGRLKRINMDEQQDTTNK